MCGCDADCDRDCSRDGDGNGELRQRNSDWDSDSDFNSDCQHAQQRTEKLSAGAEDSRISRVSQWEFGCGLACGGWSASVSLFPLSISHCPKITDVLCVSSPKKKAGDETSSLSLAALSLSLSLSISLSLSPWLWFSPRDHLSFLPLLSVLGICVSSLCHYYLKPRLGDSDSNPCGHKDTRLTEGDARRERDRQRVPASTERASEASLDFSYQNAAMYL